MTVDLFVLSIEPSERPGYDVVRVGRTPESDTAWVEFTVQKLRSQALKVGDTVPVTFTVSEA